MHAFAPKRKLTPQIQELVLVATPMGKNSEDKTAQNPNAEQKDSYMCTCTPRSKPCAMHLRALTGEARH